MTQERISKTVLIGILPEWWAGQKPVLNEPEWHNALLESGFSELEAAVWDYPDEPEHQGSMMVSRVIEKTTVTTPDVLVIGEEEDYPNGSLVKGLARAARSEIVGTPIITLDLDAQNPLAEDAAADTIFTLFESHFILKRNRGPDLDFEYTEIDGVLMIPRVVENNTLNRIIKSPLSTPVLENQPFNHFRRPLRMNVTPGFLDTIHFVHDERVVENLPNDCVEIEVKAVGLNFKDVVIGLGHILSEALGGEASGIISGVGRSVHGFVIGDRVSCYVFGTFSNFYRGTASAFQKMPEDMPFELGTPLPVTYCTAYYSVHNLAGASEEDSVLIHAATGRLGQGLVELCQLIGAEIFATMGLFEKKTLLIDRFAIPEYHIFFSRDVSFASGILRMTSGRGANVIMKSLAGEALHLTWNCTAPY
ncbi:hypothetical protein N7G274_003683 [Stereocaulon virgatum]|uniref:Enoyl reductase (ER) domain-containing protein n=1 Tax=Stereocaulon virgatum TaxID=373712 RepID=A0ABR4ABZ6_9LECA